MANIIITWHDRDGSNTVHEFAATEEAEAWLRSVLEGVLTPEELLEAGYDTDGVAMLSYYIAEELDDVGTLEIFVDGVCIRPEALSE